MTGSIVNSRMLADIASRILWSVASKVRSAPFDVKTALHNAVVQVDPSVSFSEGSRDLYQLASRTSYVLKSYKDGTEPIELLAESVNIPVGSNVINNFTILHRIINAVSDVGLDGKNKENLTRRMKTANAILHALEVSVVRDHHKEGSDEDAILRGWYDRFIYIRFTRWKKERPLEYLEQVITGERKAIRQKDKSDKVNLTSKEYDKRLMSFMKTTLTESAYDEFFTAMKTWQNGD